MHNSAQLRCFENGNDDFGVEAFWTGDAARVGYFVPLNGPLNGHPPSNTLSGLLYMHPRSCCQYKHHGIGRLPAGRVSLVNQLFACPFERLAQPPIVSRQLPIFGHGRIFFTKKKLLDRQTAVSTVIGLKG